MFLTATANTNIFDAFVSFVSDFGTFLDNVSLFIVNFFSDLTYAISLMTKFVVTIPDYFAWIPLPVLWTLYITFNIVLIYQVIGRE